MPQMTGAQFLAETVHGHGIDTVFFMPYIAPRALMEMENLGMKRVQTHEKSRRVHGRCVCARQTRSRSLYGPIRWCR